MFARRVAAVVAVLALLCTGCPGHEPQIPQEEAAKLIKAWFQNEGVPEGDNTFERGLEKHVGNVKAYSVQSAPGEMFAEIQLIEFPLKTNGVARVYSGEAKLFLHRRGGEWKVRQMALLDGDHVKERFYAKGSGPTIVSWEVTATPTATASATAPIATPAPTTTPASSP